MKGHGVLGDLEPARFLEHFWQREPRVFRGAFPGFCDPLTPDELAGLACEEGVDSRLILRRGGSRPWQVLRGPQKARRLRSLGRRDWTLLVESVDRHHVEIAAMAERFDFLPRWRMDDVMVSLAPVGGTVDAHIDSYDVFLIQGQGRRRWEVDRRARPEYRAGLDLRILKRFKAQDAWVLEPGDMLYVPPGVGHRGVTLKSDAEVALTYSIGFRAPTSADVLGGVLSQMALQETPRLYTDPTRSLVRHRSEIGREDLVRLRDFLDASLPRPTEDDWVLAAGRAATAGGGASLRTAWASLSRSRSVLFVNGDARVFEKAFAKIPAALCGDESLETLNGSAQRECRRVRASLSRPRH